MKPAIIISVLVAVVVVVAAAFIVLTNNPGDKKECDVVVTMGWEKEIIDRISDDSLNVQVLMQENTSPHAAYTTTSTVEYLNNAKLFVKIGSGVEWEDSMLEGVSFSTPTISCMDLIEAAEEGGHEGHDHGEEEHAHEEDEHAGHDHGEEEHVHEEGEDAHGEEEHAHNHDSHVWASPEHLEFIAEGLAEKLKETFPDVADKIDAHRYIHYMEHAVGVINSIITEKAPGQTIFVWHNAWNPLAAYMNEVATETLGTEYNEDNPFLKIYSAEEAGGGDTPTIDTVQTMYSLGEGGKKTIYVSPFDTASQYRSLFEGEGFTVEEINPTAGAFIAELDKFAHSLHDLLDPLPAGS
ncbi:MAG: zinc ABC transporter substrate-binding protein [Candidatus Methanoplasma sp.]|jgi:ABC-type Zn2+ transport system substrate-binding protein/surface adhesin|nr:zinc ABC transporter substrate-binding protein [Candidatus Methanoplasma sp.]